MGYCTNCGQELKGGEEFCGNCGEKVNDLGQQATQAEHTLNTNNTPHEAESTTSGSRQPLPSTWQRLWNGEAIASGQSGEAGSVEGRISEHLSSLLFVVGMILLALFFVGLMLGPIVNLVLGSPFFWLLLGIAILFAWIAATYCCIDVIQHKGHFRNPALLWFMGICASPIFLALYANTLPDESNKKSE